MNVLFVTDPLDGLLADIDASVGLMAAAQAMGAGVWACEPEDLAVVDGRVRARARRILLRPRTPRGDHRWRIEAAWFEQVERRTLDVAGAVDVVLLRIDPPVDSRYLHTTYLLDLVEDAGARVVNRPEGSAPCTRSWSRCNCRSSALARWSARMSTRRSPSWTRSAWRS